MIKYFLDDFHKGLTWPVYHIGIVCGLFVFSIMMVILGVSILMMIFRGKK